MGSQQYEVQLHGPYRWYGKKDECLFRASEATKSGIYLWTIPFNRKYLTYYVGETGRSFKARFTEHTRDYLYGLYRVYDPIPFAQGRKKLVWEGMWQPGTRDRVDEFLNRYLDLSPAVYSLLGKLRIFLAPLDAEKRIRQRIEGSLALRLQQHSDLTRNFFDSGIRYLTKQADEPPIHVTIISKECIFGLPHKLAA
jgi:hypothetical protein